MDTHLLPLATQSVIELAVAGRAQYIATRNLKDFARSQLLFPEIKICTPETLLEQI